MSYDNFHIKTITLNNENSNDNFTESTKPFLYRKGSTFRSCSKILL